MTYFNTTHVVGKQLTEYTEKAANQEEQVLRFFLARYPQQYTASEVWRQCFRESSCIFNKTPITSVRRAITNLYNAGDLVKTELIRDGIYGRPESIYRLSRKHHQGDLFK